MIQDEKRDETACPVKAGRKPNRKMAIKGVAIHCQAVLSRIQCSKKILTTN